MNKYIISIIILFSAFNLYSQHNLTMYNMHTLPQRIQTNPAQIIDSRVFVGIPGLTSVHILYGNNGFKIRNVVSVGDSNKLLIKPLEFYNSLKKDNIISTSGSIDLFYMGIKLRKSFFTLGISEKFKSQVTFPKDFLGLFIIGNAGENIGKDLNFNFGYDIMLYNDISLSMSRAFAKNKLRLGAKVSYLNGIMNLNTEKSELIFNTHQDDFHYTISNNVKFNASNILDTLNKNYEFSEKDADYNILKYKNKGMGFSFGAVYTIIPKLTVNASIVDIGFIDWKDNVVNYSTKYPNKSVEFYGLDLKTIFDDSTDMNETIDNLIDTLTEKFEMNETYKGYRTKLPTTFYLGGNLWLTKRHNFGILFYGNYYQKKLNPALTLSYNGKLTRVFGISASYSMINKSFVNGGLGFTLNGGPLQFYMVSDNIIGMIKLRDTNTIDLRFGLNLTFLRKDKQAGLSGKGVKK